MSRAHCSLQVHQNARAQISPLAGFPFIPLSQKTDALSIGQTLVYMCALKMIFSPEFNVCHFVGMHWQKHQLAHMPTNIKSVFTRHNSINVHICLASVPHCHESNQSTRKTEGSLTPKHLLTGAASVITYQLSLKGTIRLQ